MIELDAAKPSADDDPADGSDVRSVEVDRRISVQQFAGATGSFDFGSCRCRESGGLNRELGLEFPVTEDFQRVLGAGDNTILDQRVEVDGAAGLEIIER